MLRKLLFPQGIKSLVVENDAHTQAHKTHTAIHLLNQQSPCLRCPGFCVRRGGYREKAGCGPRPTVLWVRDSGAGPCRDKTAVSERHRFSVLCCRQRRGESGCTMQELVRPLEGKAKCHPLAREEERGRGVWNSFPSPSGTLLTHGAHSAFGPWQLNGKTEQS